MAKEYDPPPHKHSNSCYSTTLYCAVTPHVHGNQCYYQKGANEGQLKCGSSEHTHDNRACYTTYTKCGHP